VYLIGSKKSKMGDEGLEPSDYLYELLDKNKGAAAGIEPAIT